MSRDGKRVRITRSLSHITHPSGLVDVERHAGFVDIHCHLLPNLDDGAQNWEQSLGMARMAAADGIRAVIATPHQLGGYRANRAHTIRQRTAELRNRLQAEGIELDIGSGADVRIEPDLLKQLQDGDVLTLADQGRHVLLELPHELYFPLEPVLASLRHAGYVGILSHPERNQGILRDPNILAPLVDQGCLMQITASSLLGGFGPACRQLSQSMVLDGLAHLVASDAHGVKQRRPLLGAAFEALISIADETVAFELCCHNPREIFAGHEIGSGRIRTKKKRRWLPLGRSA